uniref:Uncharacterized protein n=1 Tax=Leersia perrieri TaxID=77586 RepID=A0A0D9VW10_9ORYZ
MRTRSQIQRLMMDLPSPCAGSDTGLLRPPRADMRRRSQSRRSCAGYGARLTNPPSGSDRCAGSEALLPSFHGSDEAIATANQLRRCSGGPKWRDWANMLPSELVEEIARRLLTVDVSEYLRFRSVCKPWRKCTDYPSLLDPRFRPHHWIALSLCGSLSRRRLVNIRTGARAEVDRPDLSTHHCFGIVDGLLLLCDKAATGAVRLLNPLTGAVAHFPAITDVRATKPTPAAGLKVFFRSSEDEVIDTHKIQVPNPSLINGAAIDDSTFPPTIMLALRNKIICAKPGDQYWVSVHYGEQREPRYNLNGKIYFYTLLSFRGHCYVTTFSGHVMRVDVRGPPRMVYLSRDMAVSKQTAAYSYLVRSQDHQKMLMVRFLSHISFAHDFYQPEEIFTSKHGVYSRMEVFEVDVAARRLIPLNGIGNFAAFLGHTYSVMLSTDKFPKLVSNAVYLNHFHQKWSHLGIYCFDNKRITPPREFRKYARGRYLCACHWELSDYLIHDIQRL